MLRKHFLSGARTVSDPEVGLKPDMRIWWAGRVERRKGSGKLGHPHPPSLGWCTQQAAVRVA